MPEKAFFGLCRYGIAAGGEMHGGEIDGGRGIVVQFHQWESERPVATLCLTLQNARELRAGLDLAIAGEEKLAFEPEAGR